LINKEKSMDTDELIRNLYSVVIIHGAVAEQAVKAIEADLPYITDDRDRQAMAKAADILRDRLAYADNELWQALTRGRRYGHD
jgi:hypothetical protein